MTHPVVNPFGDDIPAEPAPAKQTQAERVIAKFGNARDLARALARLAPERHRNPANVYRWTYPRASGGTDGLIPAKAMADVLAAAAIEGVFLSPDDLDPRPR